MLFFLASATAPAKAPGPDAATPPAAQGDAGRIGDKVDPDAYSILSEARGLNTHRPM